MYTSGYGFCCIALAFRKRRSILEDLNQALRCGSTEMVYRYLVTSSLGITEMSLGIDENEKDVSIKGVHLTINVFF